MYKKTFTITIVSLVLILALFSSYTARAQTYGPCETILEEASVGVVADDNRTDEETFSLSAGRTVNIEYAFDYANGAKGVSRVCLYDGNGNLTSFGCKPGSEGWFNATLFLPAGSYKIEAYASSVNQTGDGGGGIMISAAISVTAAKVTPTVYSVTGGGVACDGGNLSLPIGLNGSEAGITYQLLRNNVPVTTYTASGGAFSFGNFTTPGTYTVTTIAPCVAATMNGSAVITDPRPVNFTAWNDGPKCGTAPAPTVTLSATNIPGATYYWTGPYGALQTTTTNTTIINGLAGTFNYSVYAVVNGCATPTVSTPVTLYPIPPPASAGADQNLCSLTTTLNGNATGTGFAGLWTQISGPGSAQTQFQDPTAFNTIASVTTPGTYTYQWSISGAPVCGVSADQVSVTYNIMPATGTVTVSSTSPRCSNDPAIIISLGGSQTGINYQLKINGANSGAPQAGTGGTLTWPDQGSGVYTVQALGTGGCTQMMSGEHIITVNPAPTLYTVGGGGAVCTGSPFTITLSGSQVGVNYVLKRGTTTLTTLAGNGDNLFWGNQVLPGTYTITATNATTSCTRVMGTATVTLNASPSPYSVSGGGERCDDQPGLTVSLNGSQGGNIVTYQLKRDNVNVGAPVAGTGSALNWEGLTDAGTYTIQAIHSNGCTRIMTSSSPVVITTKAAPTPANAGADINACGGSTTLHANTPTVGTGMWSQIGGPVASTIATPNSPTTNVGVTQPNTYVYAWTITNSNGCVSTDNVQVIYNAIATPANAGPDQTICDDVFAVMSANTTLVGNGEWVLVSGPQGAVFFPDAYTPDAILFVADPGTYVYRWTITNQPCPASTDDVQITFGTGCLARSSGGGQRNQQSATTAESSGLTSDAVHVYPVPASESITVQIPFAGTWKAELRNMNGALLKTVTSNEKTSTLEVSDVPAGLYVLYIQSNSNRLIKKVEVVR